MSATCPNMLLDELRSRIARIEQRASGRRRTVIPLGVPAIDKMLPGGGLAIGALHEIAGDGAEIEHGANFDAAKKIGRREIEMERDGQLGKVAVEVGIRAERR